MERRTFVRLAGATTVAGVAGCLEGSGNGELETAFGEMPAYAAWLGADTTEHLVMRTNFVRAAEIDAYQLESQDVEADTDGDTGGNQSEEFGEMFSDVTGIAEAYPAVSAVGPLFLLAFLGFVYPFVDSIEFAEDDSESVENPVLTLEAIGLAGDAMLLEGEVHEPNVMARDDVTELDSHAGFTVYGAQAGFGDFFEGDGSDSGSDTDGGDSTDEETTSSIDSDESDLSPFAVGDDAIVLPMGDDATSDEAVGDGSGDTTESDTDSRSEREILESALETAAAGVDVGNEDFAWLLERCGDGAMVLGAAGEDLPDETEQEDADGTEENDVGGDLEDLNIDPETVEAFNEMLEEHEGRAVLMVADAHDEQRVTRSGFAFESGDDLPDSEELADLIAGDAADTNIVEEANRIIVEAFWG